MSPLERCRSEFTESVLRELQISLARFRRSLSPDSDFLFKPLSKEIPQCALVSWHGRARLMLGDRPAESIGGFGLLFKARFRDLHKLTLWILTCDFTFVGRYGNPGMLYKDLGKHCQAISGTGPWVRQP